MGTVTATSVAAGQEGIERLPGSVLEALGELAGAAKEGLIGGLECDLLTRKRASTWSKRVQALGETRVSEIRRSGPRHGGPPSGRPL
jgi:hypothetical protein